MALTLEPMEHTAAGADAGSSADHPLLLLHGFTQTSGSWGAFPEALRRRTIVLVDLPGHGRAGEVHADVPGTAKLLARAARDAPGALGPRGRLDVLGYSFGARVALQLALAHPELVHALVVISGTPGIKDGRAREQRRLRDERLAAELEADGDVEAFIDRWLSAPMFATLPPSQAARGSRLSNGPRGLAASLRLAGTGSQDPVWERLGHLEAPTLVITGATDPRYVAIGRRMAAIIPSAVHSVIPGAGHAVHLEQPHAVARLAGAWLDRLGVEHAGQHSRHA